MRAHGLMIKLMDMVSTLTWMEHATRVNGRRISNMERVKKHGPTEHYMKVIMLMVKNMGKVHLNGLTVLPIRVTSLITIFTVMELISGQMGVNILEIGDKIKCMEREYLSGVMEDVTREIMLMIRKKVKVHLNGPMGENI